MHHRHGWMRRGLGIGLLLTTGLGLAACGTKAGNEVDAGPLPGNLVRPSRPLPDEYPDAVELLLLRGPYLQNVTDTAITVMWEAELPCRGVVEVETADYYGHTAIAEPSARHEVRLVELPVNAAEVSYRIRCFVGESGDLGGSPADAMVGQWHSFRLAPAAGEPFRFAVYGDSKSMPPLHSMVAEEMALSDVDLVMNVGDLTDDGSVLSQWDPQFFRPAAAIMAEAPLFVSPGNHENDAQLFYDLFAFPGQENYYAFSYGDAYHVVLDSNGHALYTGSPEMEWLEETLMSDAAQGATWLFAYAHHPPYSEGEDHLLGGTPFMREEIAPLAEAAGVDIFWNGHTHDYERGELNGVTWIVTGGGGAGPDSWQQDIAHITVQRTAFHFVRVDIDGGHLEAAAIDIQGVILDQFSLDK